MKLWKSLCLSIALTAAALVPAVAQQSAKDVTVAEFPFEKAVLAEGLGQSLRDSDRA